MTILRWLVFLPIGFVTICITQILTGLLAENAPWWISVPLVLFFGMVLTIATIVPVNLAPDPKIGATILLSLFLLFEVIALFSQFGEMTGAEGPVRILTDLYLCIGALTAARSPSDRTAIALGIDQTRAEYLDRIAYRLMQEHSEHRDSQRTVEGIAQACACGSHNEFRYLIKAIDLVLKNLFNSPYKARAVLLTSWREQAVQEMGRIAGRPNCPPEAVGKRGEGD